MGRQATWHSSPDERSRLHLSWAHPNQPHISSTSLGFLACYWQHCQSGHNTTTCADKQFTATCSTSAASLPTAAAEHVVTPEWWPTYGGAESDEPNTGWLGVICRSFCLVGLPAVFADHLQLSEPPAPLILHCHVRTAKRLQTNKGRTEETQRIYVSNCAEGTTARQLLDLLN